MCGIAGIWQARPGDDPKGVVAAMTATLHQRGPDASDVWSDVTAGIVLGHARLAVLDLSPAGAQPMPSESGRFVITFNGEIYNFHELRCELEAMGARFRGNSDTEVLLAAIEQWGVEDALARANGMFAFALWDREERELWLIRDRFGEKPLYYGHCGNALIFASELKALKAYPAWDASIDRNVLALYTQFGYVPAPWSIYRGFFKLPAGCVARFRAPTATLSPNPDSVDGPQRYWSACSVASNAAAHSFNGTDTDAIDLLESVLGGSVRRRMVADVPLGAFLSGGIDSTTIVALMQAQSDRPVKTFTIGYTENQYDEANAAARVAKYLGTEHTELYVSPDDALSVIPKLPDLYNEPFADVSQIPTFLVSRLARQHVTVSLSGDGGDELFGGYNRYFWTPAIWQRIGKAPNSLRRVAGHAVKTIPPATWDWIYRPFDRLLPERLRQRMPGDRIHKLASILDVDDKRALYGKLVSFWDQANGPVVGARPLPTGLDDEGVWGESSNFVHRMMLMDTLNYLPDDILVKVDRAAMGVSLETRVPMLDPEVFAFAWSLPFDKKIRDGQGKWLLKQLLFRHVPKELVERPKMGFGVPIDAWLRGPLRDWAESLLDPSRLRTEGDFDVEMIRRKWAEHLSGRRNWQYHLWIILMYQAWLAKNH